MEKLSFITFATHFRHFFQFFLQIKLFSLYQLCMRFSSIFHLFLVMAIIYQSLKIRYFVLSFFHFSTGNLLLTVVHYFTVHRELRASKTIQEILIENSDFGVNTIFPSRLLKRKPSLDWYLLLLIDELYTWLEKVTSKYETFLAQFKLRLVYSN